MAGKNNSSHILTQSVDATSSTGKPNARNPKAVLFGNQNLYRKSAIGILLLSLISFSLQAILADAQVAYRGKQRQVNRVPSEVSIGEFHVSAEGRGNEVRWQTRDELNILSFHLYREEGNNRVLLNQ